MSISKRHFTSFISEVKHANDNLGLAYPMIPFFFYLQHCKIKPFSLEKPEMQTAFKEWTVVVDALTQGNQIIILRKGGIREGKAGFQVASDTFWLFPTQFHQQRESVIESAQLRYDEIKRAPEEESVISVSALARVEKHYELEHWEQISRLKGHHIWREDVVRERFEWGQKKALFLMIVRTYALAFPIELPMKQKYGGCRSWVELEPAMPGQDALTPILDDSQFATEVEAIQHIVTG